jgi:hypothetical protein
MIREPATNGWDARRAVQTVAVTPDGERWLGSGYLVGADLVLTAAHVLHEATSCGELVSQVTPVGCRRTAPSSEIVVGSSRAWGASVDSAGQKI